MSEIGYDNLGNQTRGPFLQPPTGATTVPEGFIADLRLYLTGRFKYTAYLKSVAYDATADTWTIVFADPDSEVALVSGALSRLDSWSPRTRGILGQGAAVAIFICGPLWQDPSWGGAGSWSQSYLPTATEIDSSKALAGPATIKRILVSGKPDPFGGLYPHNAVQKIIAGYNIGFSLTPVANPLPGAPTLPGLLQVNAGYGLGAGPAPAASGPNWISTINGQAPDGNGNINLAGKDCIRVSQLPVVHSELQIESDCTPCCGCHNYRAVAAAITKLASELDGLSTTLQSHVNAAVANYNLASTSRPRLTPLSIP